MTDHMTTSSFFFFDLQPPRPAPTPVSAPPPTHNNAAPAVPAAAPSQAPANTTPTAPAVSAAAPSAPAATATTPSKTTTPSSPLPSEADDRSDVYKAVDGTNGGEQFNGFNLMVEAYAVIWLIMLVWLGLLWQKQSKLTSRLDGLEGALSRAERKAAGGSKSASKEKAASGLPETKESST